MTWFKEDKQIKPKRGDKRIKVDWDMKTGLNILVIEDATKDDEGKYVVIAENKFGTFKFSVTVLVGRPEGGEIIKTTESKRAVTVIEETVVDGEVVERTVKEDVSEGEPKTVVEKITLEGSKPVQTAAQATLSTSEESADLTMKGVADESVTLSETMKITGTATEESLTPMEGSPPKFSQPPEPIFVDFGETIKLSCKVEGWHITVLCLNYC